MKAVLDAVARGQEVTVTHRGRACARIVQPRGKSTTGPRKRKSDVSLFGIWRNDKNSANVREHIDKLRKSRYP